MMNKKVTDAFSDASEWGEPNDSIRVGADRPGSAGCGGSKQKEIIAIINQPYF